MISECGDKDGGDASALRGVSWFKLCQLLSWPDSRVRSKRLLGVLPLLFLMEHALLLGGMERHEDTLRPTPRIRLTPKDEGADRGGMAGAKSRYRQKGDGPLTETAAYAILEIVRLAGTQI